ncbi:peroxide stress protein YaaA [Corynebacterium sp. CCM 8862]|uniref:Peroxide stress protein YaaA n=1 Tax=Corynebacterium mendelii TaxID=2765362 RepID=A0A939E021_9CORY|nr:peroxide stress protein YaaA [Corynebacterium mendelii]MBN9643261.1 peroxide stress protein YaaA [Corynebacterium mendelii]
MLIVLPPSETKAAGGSGAPIDWQSLSFPELNPTRKSILADLLALEPSAMQQALKLSDKMTAEVEANHNIPDAPTCPAIERYTGVLYDALDAASLTDTARARLAVGSALFGVVRAGDMIPRYRLSGGSKIPGAGYPTPPTMKARWATTLTAVIDRLVAEEGPVVDMRSGAYRNLGPATGAIDVRVESVQPDGSRKVVSHHNKHYKGVAARKLALAEGEPETIDDIAAVIEDADTMVEVSSPTALTMIVQR